jgi:hypothetical protein
MRADGRVTVSLRKSEAGRDMEKEGNGRMAAAEQVEAAASRAVSMLEAAGAG